MSAISLSNPSPLPSNFHGQGNFYSRWNIYLPSPGPDWDKFGAAALGGFTHGIAAANFTLGALELYNEIAVGVNLPQVPEQDIRIGMSCAFTLTASAKSLIIMLLPMSMINDPRNQFSPLIVGGLCSTAVVMTTLAVDFFNRAKNYLFQ